jgi:hypothetical protein
MEAVLGVAGVTTNVKVSGERPVMGFRQEKGSKIGKNKEGSKRREERAQGVLPSWEVKVGF